VLTTDGANISWSDVRDVLAAGDDRGLVVKGTYTGAAATPPATGAGARMMWYPQKAAFRAGQVFGTEWDDANVGIGSIALGVGATASGPYSTAMGGGTASGFGSTTLGGGTASGDGSTTMGGGTASGRVSTAMGRDTTASGQTSTAMGRDTTASGQTSTAMGRDTTAAGVNSTAMGYGTTANGDNSTAIGVNTFASGTGSLAMGDSTVAFGVDSTAMGGGTIADSLDETIVGANNVRSGGNSTSWIPTDALFTVGNGSSDSARSNAFQILKNGNATLNGTLSFKDANTGPPSGTAGWKLNTWGGAFGIGIDSATQWYSVGGGSSHVFYANNTKVMSLDASGNLKTLGTMTASTTPDLAETIPAADDVTAGDVVCADPLHRERVVRCGARAKSVLGVISDGSGGFLINSHGSMDDRLTGKPLVLAGRVPVQVSTENGPIAIGDWLAPSSQAGVAVRATEPGPVVGIALESFSGKRGAVLCFVKVGEGGSARLAQENARLRERNREIEARNREVEARLARLENAMQLLGQRASR
jgi:hypothetical protein